MVLVIWLCKMATIPKPLIVNPKFKSITVDVKLAKIAYWRMRLGIWFLKLGCRLLAKKVFIHYDHD